MKKLLAFISSFFLLTKNSLAHCPLCTAGAGAAAGVATYLGIDFAVIGVLIGGFSWALGSWTAKWFRKKFGDYFSQQKLVITILIYGSIIVPGYFWMPEATPITLWMIGEYGTTLSFNNFLAGGLVGGLIVSQTPRLSKKISEIRGETFPYQGMSLTFILLVIAGIFAQVLVG